PADQGAREAARRLQIPIWECGLDEQGRVFVRQTRDLNSEVRSQRSDASSLTSDLCPLTSDIALFLHTSGTTSRPKGVPLTHGNLMASIANIAATYQLTRRDRSLIVMPLFHVHGLIGATLSTLHTGGAVVIPAKFSAGSFWQIASKYDVT